MIDYNGLINKYDVRRFDLRDRGYKDKHFGCKLFVLDLTHDSHARVVMYRYAERIKSEQPNLSKDLFDLLYELDEAEADAEATNEIKISIPEIPEGIDKAAVALIMTQVMTDILASGKVEVHREIETGFSCAICRDRAARPIGLVGGYETVLCADHANAWHGYISDHPKFLTLDVIKIDYNIALLQEERSSALEFKQQERQVRRQLFTTGKEWVKTNYEEYQMKLASLRLQAMRDDMHLDDTE